MSLFGVPRDVWFAIALHCGVDVEWWSTIVALATACRALARTLCGALRERLGAQRDARIQTLDARLDDAIAIAVRAHQRVLSTCQRTSVAFAFDGMTLRFVMPQGAVSSSCFISNFGDTRDMFGAYYHALCEVLHARRRCDGRTTLLGVRNDDCEQHDDDTVVDCTLYRRYGRQQQQQHEAHLLWCRSNRAGDRVEHIVVAKILESAVVREAQRAHPIASSAPWRSRRAAMLYELSPRSIDC